MGKPATKQRDEVQSGSNTNKALLDYVHRFEFLNVTKDALAEDFKTLGQEAKSEGFDVSIIKELVKARKDAAKARERAQLLSTYAAAIQMDLF